MSDDEWPETELNSFAAALAALVPKSAVSREELLYEAGRAAGRRETQRRERGWIALACAASLAVVLALVPRGEPVMRARIEQSGPAASTVERPPAPSANPAPQRHQALTASSYLALRATLNSPEIAPQPAQQQAPPSADAIPWRAIDPAVRERLAAPL